MSFRPLRVLAGFALICGSFAAQANQIPGTVFYSALLKFKHPAPSTAISEYVVSVPTMAECQSQANAIIQARTNSPYYYTLHTLQGCAFHVTGFSTQADVALPLDLLNRFGVLERDLRKRYGIDEYEVELSKLYQRLQSEL